MIDFTPFDQISDGDLTEMFAAYVAAVNVRGGYVFPREMVVEEISRMAEWLKVYESMNGGRQL